MDWEEVHRRFEASSRRVSVPDRECSLYLPFGEFWPDENADPESDTADIFDDPGVSCEMLLVFVWDSLIAPVSFSISLSWISAGGEREYVGIFREGDFMPQIVAAYERSDRIKALKTLLHTLFADGQGSCCREWLSSLPDITENHRPDLIPLESICKGYWAWLESEPTEWVELRDRVLGDWMQPDPMKRGFERMEKVIEENLNPQLGKQRKMSRENESLELTDEDRVRILLNCSERYLI